MCGMKWNDIVSVVVAIQHEYQPKMVTYNEYFPQHIRLFKTHDCYKWKKWERKHNVMILWCLSRFSWGCLLFIFSKVSSIVPSWWSSDDYFCCTLSYHVTTMNMTNMRLWWKYFGMSLWELVYAVLPLNGGSWFLGGCHWWRLLSLQWLNCAEFKKTCMINHVQIFNSRSPLTLDKAYDVIWTSCEVMYTPHIRWWYHHTRIAYYFIILQMLLLLYLLKDEPHPTGFALISGRLDLVIKSEQSTASWSFEWWKSESLDGGQNLFTTICRYNVSTTVLTVTRFVFHPSPPPDTSKELLPAYRHTAAWSFAYRSMLCSR